MAQQPLPHDEPSNETLAARTAGGDVVAFTTLYDRHARAVYTLAAHLLGGSEAEEIVQSVFLTLWHKAGQFDAAQGSFNAWFMTIARRRVLDELRRRGQRQGLAAAGEVERVLAQAPDPTVNIEEQACLRERGDVVLRALRTLPDEQRRVLVLAYFGGASQAAIAHHLGLPLGTVKKRVSLGLRKLRVALAGQGLEVEAPAGPSPTRYSTRVGDGEGGAT